MHQAIHTLSYMMLVSHMCVSSYSVCVVGEGGDLCATLVLLAFVGD